MLVQVARVPPQVQVADQPPLADLAQRVVAQVEAGQRRPQPHVGLGDALSEQEPPPCQPPVQFLKTADQQLA
jgi:hypothetical protein